MRGSEIVQEAGWVVIVYRGYRDVNDTASLVERYLIVEVRGMRRRKKEGEIRRNRGLENE